MTRVSDRASSGFALIEVMVAIGVLVVVLLGAASMSLTAQAHVARSAEQTVASALAQARVEWLRNQGAASADLDAGTTTEILGGDYSGYSRTTVVQDDVPLPNVKRVQVTAITPSGMNVTVVSLVAE